MKNNIFGAFVPPPPMSHSGTYVPPDYDAMLDAQKANPNIATNLAVAQARLANVNQKTAAFTAAHPSEEEMEAKKKEEKKSNMKKYLIIAGSGVGVLGLGALAYFKIFKKKKR